MATYRLLFFRGSQLSRWESFEAAGTVHALERAASEKSDDLVELWSGEGRVASFRPVGSRHK